MAHMELFFFFLVVNADVGLSDIILKYTYVSPTGFFVEMV